MPDPVRSTRASRSYGEPSSERNRARDPPSWLTRPGSVRPFREANRSSRRRGATPKVAESTYGAGYVRADGDDADRRGDSARSGRDSALVRLG